MYKKIVLSLLSAYIICSSTEARCSTWTDSGNYDTSWYDDFSTSFEIYTSEQFAGFAFLCNNDVHFAGKTVNLMADIDMRQFDFPKCQYFTGTFNGNGHKISNVIVVNGSSDYASLFEKIGSSGTICNTYFKNTTVNVAAGSRTYAGGIAGDNHGVITDCTIDGNITIRNNSDVLPYSLHAGGISCHNYGKVFNCTNMALVKVETFVGLYSFDGYVGGIAALNEGSIVNCINYGEQYAYFGRGVKWTHEGYVGGISGYSTGQINNVVNIANVTGATKEYVQIYVDGICAYGNCTNAYYSSSAVITGDHISHNGILLSLQQTQNQTLDFTSLLNSNLESIDISPKTFWANSPDYYNNEPFLLNSLNMDLQSVDVSQSSISVVCQPIQLESSWIIEKGFEYQKQGSDIIQPIVVNEHFSSLLNDLEPDALYDIRAFVKGKTGIVYSKNLNIITSAPSIQTLDATEITPVSATLNGKIDVGNTPIKSQGFLWKEQDGEYSVILTQGSEYSVKIDHLKPSTTYIYQAYAIDELDKSIYGNEVIFKTLPVNVILDNIKTTLYSIELNGHINLNMATDIIVEYRESNIGAFAHQKVISESDGQFSTTIDGLWSDTEYEIRAYFVYDKSTVFSSLETISTLQIEITTLTPFVNKYVEFYGTVNGTVKSGEFGFEYRDINIPDIIPSKYIVCSINDNRLAGIPTDLENGRKYKVRAYYKSPSNKYSFGQWIDFLPTDLAAVDNIEIDNEEEVIAVYNAYGQRVNTFTKGINLVILSNGQTKKVIF